MGRPIFTEVLSHYGKNPVLSREVTTWEKHQLFSTAGYASVPAFIADRYFGRVPHQPAQPPSRQSLLLGGGRDCAQKGWTAAHLLPGPAPGLSAGIKAKSALLDGWPERFTFCLTGDAETNRLKSEANRRFRLHRLAETYITIGNAGVLLYPDEKPKVFAQTGFGGEAVTYPVFYSSREVKELGADATQIRSSRFAGVLLAPTGIFVTYNSGGALMKWRYKSELRVKTLLWNILCQQRLAQQYRVEQVHGLVLGDSMDLAYQILTSTGGAKHDYFMLDGSYDHFYFLTNDHQGEVILALLCDPVKTAELDRILSQGLSAGNPGSAMEQDAAEPDGTPVLFGYFCDLPRIVRFNTSLELMERPGTLICFDFQADVLRRYCGDRVHLQTIDFTKFEGRLFP